MTRPPKSPAPRSQLKLDARGLHRLIAPVLGLALLYIGTTGVWLQSVDLQALLSHAPASDANIEAIRESLDGPSSFAVIATPDFTAPSLPANLLASPEITALADAAHRTTAAPIKYVELRVVDGRPVGQVMTDKLLRFDATSLAPLPVPPAQDHPRRTSAHLLAKQWHRTWALGDGWLWLNALAAIGLGVMMVTGLLQYLQLFRARLRLDRRAVIWSAGGVWRTWHRGIALTAALFLGVVAVSGTLLAIDSFALQVFRWTHPKELMFGMVPVGMVGDFSSPMATSELPSLLTTTLDAYNRLEGDRPIKVIRLRSFAGIPQGVVVAGGPATQQFVFNAKTGAGMTSSEPGYPYMGFPFGWREHELMKTIHRGDILGLPGRVMDLLAGLALIYLSLSGLWLYFSRRKPAKRTP